MFNKIKILFADLVIFILFLSCTTNPFFKDKITFAEMSSITGTVVLEGAEDHSGILVYLEEFEIFAETDINGNYKIEIPKAHLQPGEGLTGVYKIYYYVANYKVRYSTVFIHKGEFVFGSGDLAENGKIFDRTLLTKMLDVKTEINPVKIEDNYDGKINIKVTLINMVDSVIVFSHLTKQKNLASAYLSSPNKIHLLNQPSNFIGVVIDTTLVWEMEVDWIMERDSVLPNNYKVIPYLQVYQQEIPNKMLDYFGFNATLFTENFLNIPFRQKSADFKVSSASN